MAIDSTRDKPRQAPLNVDREYEQSAHDHQRAYSFGMTAAVVVVAAIFLAVVIAAIVLR